MKDNLLLQSDKIIFTLFMITIKMIFYIMGQQKQQLIQHSKIKEDLLL